MALSLDEALGMSLADEADESIHVDVNTRQITIPESQKLFGVESDSDVEVKHIVIDGRYAYGNRDLSKLAWRVIYRNANKDSSYYLIPSVVANENSIEMDWLIKRSVVAYKGTVDFILCAFATTSSGEVTPEWNSTLGHGIVLEGLETSAIDINKEVVDELSKILYETIKARDAAASSATDATQSASAAASSKQAAAASERNAEASKNLAVTSASNASASEIAAKASANKAQALVDGIPDDYTTALNDISRLKENKLDKPNNPVVGQLLRVKSISDTGEITLETVADNDDNKLPTGGSTGQVLAKKSDESFDAEWVDAVAGTLPKGGYPGFILQKKSVSDFDAEWVSIGGNYPSEVWKNKNNLGTFGAIGIDIGASLYVSGKRTIITSDYTLCYTDAEDISANYPQMLIGNKTMYTITVPGTRGARITDYSFKMQTARGYRYVYIDTDVSYGLMFTDGFNMQGAKDNSVAIPYIIFARYERY